MSTFRFHARQAHSREAEAVIDLYLTAFADEAVISWALPDPETRYSYLEENSRPALAAAVESGLVILAASPSGELAGASSWIPQDPADSDESEPEVLDGDTPARRMAAAGRATQDRRPDVPHLLLSSMATAPMHRGRGAGSAMITAGVDRGAQLGLPIYLEASTPGSRRLYERFGFRDHGEPISLPENGPMLQPMWLGR